MTDSPPEANFGGRVLGCIEANCINGLFRSAYDPEWTVPDGHVLFRSADRKSQKRPGSPHLSEDTVFVEQKLEEETHCVAEMSSAHARSSTIKIKYTCTRDSHFTPQGSNGGIR